MFHKIEMVLYITVTIIVMDCIYHTALRTRVTSSFRTYGFFLEILNVQSLGIILVGLTVRI